MIILNWILLPLKLTNVQEKLLVDMDVVMMLLFFVPAKVLLHVWLHNFYDTALSIA